METKGGGLWKGEDGDLRLNSAVLSCPVLSNYLQTYEPSSTRLLCPGGFSRQEYWSGLPCPPPGDLPNSGIKPKSPALQADSLPAEPPGKSQAELYFYFAFN